MMGEPAITINGVPLSEGQAMTVRVACTDYQFRLMHEPDACGTDEHGLRMHAAYSERLHEVLTLMTGGTKDA